MRALHERRAPWLTARFARRCADTDVVADVMQDPISPVSQKRGPHATAATSAVARRGARAGIRAVPSSAEPQYFVAGADSSPVSGGAHR
jgi:hypothetical protein